MENLQHRRNKATRRIQQPYQGNYQVQQLDIIKKKNLLETSLQDFYYILFELV